MNVVKIIDSKTKKEVATCTAFAFDDASVVDVTNFGAKYQTWMPMSSDIEMHVDNFKTPIEDTPSPTQELITERVRVQRAREDLATTQIILAALVKMMGGAVSISSTEINAVEVGKFVAENTVDGGLIMRFTE